MRQRGQPHAVDEPVPVEVLLADGGIARIRVLSPKDGPALSRLHQRASDSSLRHRFFAMNRHLADEYVDTLLRAPDRCALVAEVAGDVVALATAEPITPDTAEIAFLVDDHMHGRGLGTLLLEHLAAFARRRGILGFVAEVLAENISMLRVFRDAGYDVERYVSGGVVSLRMSTQATDRAVAAADARERAAEARSLEPLLAPHVVAVAGAGRERGGIGREVLENIRAGGFAGRLYAIHPRISRVGEVPAYRTVSAVPERVDLLLVAVPAHRVLGVVADAARSGTRVAVILTSGFAELGGAKGMAQRAMVKIARQHGMRLVGPNCLGIVATEPGSRLNATFATISLEPGPLAVASQSGSVGIALLDVAAQGGLGVRSFVSLGNKADVSGNDLLAAWTEDPTVRAAALYLESLGNPRKFARIARRFAEEKPLLAVVGGTSDSGRRTGAIRSTVAPAAAVDALLTQSGVIGVGGIDELIDTARLLVDQPLPHGGRIAIVGNAGGMGVLAADSAQRDGLVVPELSSGLRSLMAVGTTGIVRLGNPIDLGVTASAPSYEKAIRQVLDSGEVDAICVLVAATSVCDREAVLDAVGRATADAPDVPAALVLVGHAMAAATVGARRVPVYRSVESATRALAHAARYAVWRTSPRGATPDLDDARLVTTRPLAAALVAGMPDGRWLTAEEAGELLRPYGVQVPVGELVHDAAGAVAAAERVGYPVVVKVADPEVVHKTDRGLVAVGLGSPDQVHEAASRIAATIGADGCEILVQPQIHGVEMAVGVVYDPSFGPMIMVAAGGVATDVWADRVFLMPPVTDIDVARAIRALRISPLLFGHHGAPACNVPALERLVLAVARLAQEMPEVAELDLNPVIVDPAGVHCVDVRLRLQPPVGSADDTTLRRLRAPA